MEQRIMAQQYLLTRSEIVEIVKLTINEAYSGEHMDMPVLWLKIDRDVLSGNETDL